MGEDSSHAERSSSNSSTSNNNPASPVLLQQQQQQQQQHENMDLLIPSFSPNSAPSSPTHTLTRLGLRSPTTGPSSPVERGQVSAITVVALLDKLVHMLEAVQENQRRMERRQAELEGAVRGVQGDVTRLSKSHAATSGSVAKLLERSRKAGGHMKEVRERMDKQAVQVKRLEANHAHLLKRNHFKVLIFQDDTEIPSSVLVKDPVKTPRPASQLDADEEAASQTAASVTGVASRSHEEGLHTISLTSDEDEDLARPRGEEEEDDQPLQRAATLGPGAGGGAHSSSSHAESSRADKLKRSSLRKVDSLKRAFSRQSIEKKMSKIGTKIVPPERREQIKKSFAAPNRPKSPAAKSSSFKVAPMTFNVTKVRDGKGEAAAAPAGGSPGRLAHVEIPRLGSLDGDGPLAAVLHSQEDGADGREEERAEEEETASPSTPGCPEIELAVNGGAGSPEIDLELNGGTVSSEIDLTVNGGAGSPKIDLAVNGGAGSPEIDLTVNGKAASPEIDPDANRPAKLAFPERDEDEEEDDDDNEEPERENPGAPAAPLPASAITVEPAS